MKPVRAFLSHSSKDKEFVRAVADELGRQFCVFDERSFTTGVELLAAIRDGMTSSSLFVLFASRNALESPWVDFEATDAAYHQAMRSVAMSMVFIIDSDVTHEDLPAWLRRALIRRAISPRSVAREIRAQIDALQQERHKPVYVGRHTETQAIEAQLLPADGTKPPRILFVSGLSGIGRETLTARIATGLLSLKRTLRIPVASGDLLVDITVKLAANIAPFNTADGLKRLRHEIEAETDSEHVSRIEGYLAAACESGELPIFFDEGGLLGSDGELAPWLARLLRLVERPDVYIACITTRRPLVPDWVPAHVMARVLPLATEDIVRLLVALSTRDGPPLNAAQAKELSEYINGYPPSAYYAMQLARQNGVPWVLANKAPLVDFRAGAFVPYVSKYLNLSDIQRAILITLARYNPLPLSVLASGTAVDGAAISNALPLLIDAALVFPDDRGHYWLSPPVVDAVSRAFSGMSVNDAGVAAGLDAYLRSAEPDERTIELSQALFRASTLAGSGFSDWAIEFAADLIRLAKQYYDSRQYEQAVSIARRATVLRPDNFDAHWYLIRGLVQEERYEEAQLACDELGRRNSAKEYSFLMGFLERHRGRFDVALAHYKKSIDLGRGGVAVHREIATCYWKLGDLAHAREHIDRASNLGPINRYVVDLQTQIATGQGDESAARQALRRLSVVDDASFYWHRVSTVEAAFARKREALEAAKTAVEVSDRPPFHVLSNYINLLVEVGRIEDADAALRRLNRNFPRVKQDIRNMLACKLAIARKKYRAALIAFDAMSPSAMKLHSAMKREILLGLLASNVVTDAERSDLTAQAQRLAGSTTQGALSFEFDDDDDPT